ncbi:unnamed protein product [Owenia fusiformis]|uniref:Uncharacterized protein n=1 Tax=Owenia fusiformis TaxID=6347 RepID=A0A8S4N7P8_OWEFU|nr:unnamed protein product [Owenia fusiformis]
MLQNQQKNQVPIASTLTQAPNSLTQAQNPLAQATNTLTQPPKPSTQAPTMLTQVSTTFSTQVSSILTQAPNTLPQATSILAQAEQAQNTMTQVPSTLIQATNILAQAPNTLTQAKSILAQAPTPNISMQAPSTLAQHTNTLIQTPNTLTQQAQQAIPASQTTPVANQTVNQEKTLNAGTSSQPSNLQVTPLGQPNLQAQPVLYQSSQPAASYPNSQANIGVNAQAVQSIGSQVVQVTSMANYASIQSNVALGGASHEPHGVQSHTVLNTQIVQATPRVEPSHVGLPPPGVQSNPVLGQATPAIQSNLTLPPPGVQSNPVLGVQTGQITPQFQSALPPPGVQTNPQLSGQVRPATPDLQSNLALPPPGLQTNPVLGGQITPNVQSNVAFPPPGIQTNPVLGAQMAQTALPTPAVSYPQTNFSVPPPQIQDPLLSYEIDREKAIQLSRRTKGIDIDRSQLNIETTQFGYHSNIDTSASSSSTLTTNPFINRIAKVEPMPPAEKHQSNPFLELDCTMEFMNRVRRLEFIKDVWNFGPKIFCSLKTIPGCWEINTSTDVVELYYQLLKSGGQ